MEFHLSGAGGTLEDLEGGVVAAPVLDHHHAECQVDGVSVGKGCKEVLAGVTELCDAQCQPEGP